MMAMRSPARTARFTPSSTCEIDGPLAKAARHADGFEHRRQSWMFSHAVASVHVCRASAGSVREARHAG